MKISKYLVLFQTMLILCSLTACKKEAAPDTSLPLETEQDSAQLLDVDEVENGSEIEQQIPPYLVLEIGGTATLPVVDSNGNPLVWSSSDAEIISVDDAGLVCGMEKGEASLSVSGNGTLAAISVYIVDNPEDFLLVDQTSIELAVGESMKIPYIYGGTQRLGWVSYDLMVADMSLDGTVTGVHEGETVVSVGTGRLYQDIAVKVVEKVDTVTTPAGQVPSEVVSTSPAKQEPTASETTSPATQPTTSPTERPNVTNPPRPTEATEPKPTIEAKPTTPTSPTKPAAALKITTSSFTLDIGGTKVVSYSYTGNKTLTWRTSNSNVATVSGANVKAVGPGTSVITVSDGTLSAQVTVTVRTPATKPTEPKDTEPTKPAASLKITTGSFSLDVGDTKTVSYLYTGSKALTWHSSNTDVATVSGDTVRAVRGGTAVITVTDGTLNAQVTVTVNTPKPIEPPKPAAKLELSTTSISMYVGETKKIGYTYTGTGAIRFETDFGRVSVDGSGNVTALSVGTDYVYVTDGSLEKCCTIDVKEKETVPTATNIKFDCATGPLGGTYYVGNSLSFDAVVNPNEADRHVSVSSSNNGVATVSANHAYGANTVYINFVGEGSVTITVTSADGCASNSLSFEVKTYEPEIPANELTPEQYARAVVNAMVAAGMEEASGLEGWTLVNVSEGQLNNDNAYSVGTSFASHLWANGYRHCNCVYIGKDGDTYQFYVQF